jgi:16S rRNA (guanine966-N2)-methyltransferase
MNKSLSQVRIIGGKMRGRKVMFQDALGLRPTQDRIRETLFNWLQHDLEGSHCLDLFAGSGALGFEALSRGATRVVMTDNNMSVIKMLNDNADRFGDEKVEIHHFDFLKDKYIPFKDSFDLVFLDPPFHERLIEPALSFLTKNGLLAKGALIYVECEAGGFDVEGVEMVKHKKTKTLEYMLLKPNASLD